MTTAAQLKRQIEALQEDLKAARAKETEELAKEIVKIRPKADALLQEKFGFTLAQIFTAPDPNKLAKKKEYVHPETGEKFVPRKGKKHPDWVLAQQKAA